MKNKIVVIVLMLFVIFVGLFFYFYKNSDRGVVVGGDRDSHGCILSAGYTWCEVKNKCLRSWEEGCEVKSVFDAVYNIDGVDYKLSGGTGYSNETKNTATIFGAPENLDINNDGVKDYVMLITVSGSGSGTFFYVAGAVLDKIGNISTTNSIFVGDRIAPQNINMMNGKVVVNYADRKTEESMSARPSIGVSKYFQVSGNILKEVKNYSSINVCEGNGGVWYPDENICEMNQLSKEECIKQGGKFNECASACRHDKKAEVCTMQCVLTCSFR
jgi:hypothetical protein